MTDRPQLALTFLRDAGWETAQRAPLAGDASNRRYERLYDPVRGTRAVLMDAPKDRGEDVEPFLRIARFLSGIGLSAPAILAEDVDAGFILLEDLGDDLFARVMAADPNSQQTLYGAATDALVALHAKSPPENLDRYSPVFMAKMSAMAYEWYLGCISPERAQHAAEVIPELERLLEAQASDASVLIQRDYHAENLLWLPEREGVARVGMLDFQDAMTGHPAYDLVSLMQDARRDVPPQYEEEMIARYCTATNQGRDAFEAAYRILGTQRNLRIIGIFARLGLRDGKRHYIDLVPRVWGYLKRDISHPALAGLADRIERDFPEPDAGTLEKLRDACDANQTL